MYDLEIIVPSELESETIVTRLKDFKKWGLMNTDGFKIKMYFLASFDNKPEDLNELCSGWPANFDVEGIITPYKHVAQRIMHYYSKIMQPDTARWYVRLDEDSRTDVASLLEKMDQWFDHTRDYYVVGEISKEVEGIEYKILTTLGYDWYDEVVGHNFDNAPIHEIEISITSNSAVKKILSNPDCMRLLELRSEFDGGFGDNTFGYAARIVKIYQISVPFLTRNPRAIELSLYGGRYCHIHDISRDRHGNYVRWLDITDGYTNPELSEEILGKNYFLHCNNDKKWVGFDKRGKIYIKNSRCKPEWSHETETIGIWGFTEVGDLSIFITHDFSINKIPIVFDKDGPNFICQSNKNTTLIFSNNEAEKISVDDSTKIKMI